MVLPPSPSRSPFNLVTWDSIVSIVSMNEVLVGGSAISSERLLPWAESDRRAPAKIRTDEEAAVMFG